MRGIDRVGLALSMGRQWRSLPKPPIEGYPSRRELTRRELAGRLTEISGWGDTSVLTLASLIVLDAQREGEPVAWITTYNSSFYPPDMARAGIDLEALPVIRCPDIRAMARAADRLARSGAFGVLVLDLGSGGELPLPLQTRLAGLAHLHNTAILFLTEKTREAPSVSSLISLRLEAGRAHLHGEGFSCRFHALKDKRFGPGWVSEMVCHGPPGLC